MSAVDALKNRFGSMSILKVLGVAASTHYGWLAQERDPSPRRRSDADLLGEITEIHQLSAAPTAHRACTRCWVGAACGCRA